MPKIGGREYLHTNKQASKQTNKQTKCWRPVTAADPTTLQVMEDELKLLLF